MTQGINPLIERVGISMWKVQRRIMSQMSMHKEIGLTMPQFRLLHMISQEKQARVVHLADKLEVKSSAVTVMLDRLELLELIARVPDENDRRAVIVTITGKGQEVLEEAERQSMQLLEEHLSILKPEELQNFADYYLILEKQER
jgi:DNA-binding MarR family transcriptional regulator